MNRSFYPGNGMAHLNDLAREYEARHFPPMRRLDLHADGPDTARRRAERWIQTFAHEQPGANLLIVVERGGRGGRPTAVRTAVQSLLDGMVGGLLEWWQPFGPGSLTLRVALDPRTAPLVTPVPEDPTDGRTEATAGAVLLTPEADIPGDLLPLARRGAELRRTREGLSVGLLQVVLRRVWIEAQARAMDQRVSFGAALEHIVRDEELRVYEED